MIEQRRFVSCNVVKIIRFLICYVFVIVLILALESAPAIYANGPIPFSESFDTFTGIGFDPNPGTGQLNSDIWVVTGLSDGDGTFGGTHVTGDFARGPSNGGAGTGGIYAFDVGGGNNILGIQPIGSDFAPGDIILRLQNNTGSTLTQLDVSYNIWYLNDQPRANSLNLSHSPDNLTYTPVSALDFTTLEPADALPSWQSTPRSTTLTGLNIANGGYFYLKWTGDDVSGGGSRDEYGLDNVQVLIPVGDSPPTVSASTPINGATNVAVDTNITINFSENVTAAAPWFTLNCTVSGGHTATVSDGPQTYTLDPNGDFSNSETCTVTILASQIADQDGTPDNMPADYVFSFTTVAPPAAWIINEIHADPDATAGDANGDGIFSSGQDEFVEIINNTGSTANISGWTFSDNTAVRHTFPTDTVLPDQCAVVVFAGGTPTGPFGDAIVHTAGSLGLNNGGDTVTLRDGGGTIQVAHPYGNEGGDNQSLTRDPDLTGPNPLVKHSTATGSGGALFSPGTRVDGSKFAGCSRPRVVATTPVNGATSAAVDANITIQFSENVTVTDPWFTLNCTNSGGHTVAVSGGPQTYTLNPDANFSNSETCTVTILASQVADQDDAPDNMVADYVFTFTTAAPPAAWIINEIHADPDAAGGDANSDGTVDTGQDEFVEIINNTGSAADISGWTLSDNTSVRHTFPTDTVLPDQCAVVVFAGGGATGTFGDAIVQTAGSLGLNNGGDTVTLKDSGGTTRTTHTYGNEGGDNQSLTRDPDLTGSDPLVKHSTATGSGGALFSPGTRVDGSRFAGCGLPRVVATTPTNGTTNVPVNTTITINFSEAVTTNASSFSLECPIGTAIAFNISPAPPGSTDTFILTPTSNLPNSTTCTVTVDANEVIDQDDSPETMVNNYIFAFTTDAPVLPILISEFLYDGITPTTEGDEFVELCNSNAATVDLTGYKVGDEEVSGGGESMVEIPAGTTLVPNACLVIAKNGADFQARFGVAPTFEAGALTKYTTWGSGSWSLSNTGDELVVLGPGNQILDSVAYRNGDYATLGLEPDATAPAPHSLQRIWPTDTDSMLYDFVRTDPTPGVLTLPPPPVSLPPAALPDGMNAYWGHLHAHSNYSDGAGPPHYAYDLARAAGLHYYGLTDHSWWMTLAEWDNTFTQTTNATVPGQFIALRGQEWSHATAGHINIFNTNTLIQRTNPQFDTLAEVYNWLVANPGAIAQFNHPDPSYGGTFSDFALDPAASQGVFMQEIGNNAQIYTTYEPSFVQANAVGWKVGPVNNGDTHSANWGTDIPARTGIVAPALTESDLLAAIRARRVFATEDNNLALALRLDGNWMGSVLTNTGSLPLIVDIVDPNPEPVTLYIYDSNLLLATVPLSSSTAQWSTTVEVLPGHFYWVKAVQADGDTAYSAPVWIEGQVPIDALVINEILPSPNAIDWDGDGAGNSDDEWVEIFNPLDRPVGLGGWRLHDAAGVAYNIPLGLVVPAGGYATLYKAQTGIGLNNGGDTLTLTHPNGTVIDTVAYSHSPGYDQSWCRLPDGGSTWSDDCIPSPTNINGERPPAGPLHVKIAEAKKLAYNAWVVVKGSVTAPPGVLGDRTMYIQDDTAGIMIYLPKDHRLILQPGDIVEVEGNLRTFHHEFEIVVDERRDVDHTGHGPPPPPLPIATTSLLEPYEGMLVMLQGQAVGFRGRSTMWVDDSTGWAKIVIRRSTGIKKPFIEYGTPMTVVGIVSQHSTGDDPSRDDYRLLPRYQFDLQLPAPAPPPQLSTGSPQFLPETGY